VLPLTKQYLIVLFGRVKLRHIPIFKTLNFHKNRKSGEILQQIYSILNIFFGQDLFVMKNKLVDLFVWIVYNLAVFIYVGGTL